MWNPPDSVMKHGMRILQETLILDGTVPIKGAGRLLEPNGVALTGLRIFLPA